MKWASSGGVELKADRLLVRLPNWVGDAVMATAALRALREAQPGATIAVQGRGFLQALLGGGELFDQFIPIGKSTSENVTAIEKFAPALAVILPHSFRSAWEVYRAGVPLRVGYAREGRGPLLTHSLRAHRNLGSRGLRLWKRLLVSIPGIQNAVARRWPKYWRARRDQNPYLPVPMVFQYLELVALLGVNSTQFRPELPRPAELEQPTRAQLCKLGLEPDQPFFAVNAGASFGESKIYPIELLSRVVADFRDETGLIPLLLCGPGEESLVARLAQAVGERVVSTHSDILLLDRLKQAISEAEFLITTDTGPWHCARALGTPSLCLMGPTDPRYTAFPDPTAKVIRREIECSPCHLKRCPRPGHPCLSQLLPDQVLRAALAQFRAHRS